MDRDQMRSWATSPAPSTPAIPGGKMSTGILEPPNDGAGEANDRYSRPPWQMAKRPDLLPPPDRNSTVANEDRAGSRAAKALGGLTGQGLDAFSARQGSAGGTQSTSPLSKTPTDIVKNSPRDNVLKRSGGGDTGQKAQKGSDDKGKPSGGQPGQPDGASPGKKRPGAATNSVNEFSKAAAPTSGFDEMRRGDVNKHIAPTGSRREAAGRLAYGTRVPAKLMDKAVKTGVKVSKAVIKYAVIFGVVSALLFAMLLFEMVTGGGNSSTQPANISSKTVTVSTGGGGLSSPCSTPNCNGPLTSFIDQKLTGIYLLQYAIQAHVDTGVFPSVVIAQWYVDHTFQTASINKNEHNFGNVSGAVTGMVGLNPHNSTAIFPNYQVGFDAYIITLNSPPYITVRNATSYQAMAIALGKSPWAGGHYTTAPSCLQGCSSPAHPGNMLLGDIALGNLTMYDPPTVNTVGYNPSGAKIALLAEQQVGQHYQKYTGGGVVEWCALFATWVWQNSGIKITHLQYAYSGNIFVWGETNGTVQLVKTGQSPTVQPGDILLYGSPAHSVHADLVFSVNNGSIMTIDGNAGTTSATDAVKMGGPMIIATAVKDQYPGPVWAVVSPFKNKMA